MYDAQADTISVNEISSDSNNRIILGRFQINNADERHKTLLIQNEYDEDEDCNGYVPEGAHDMGWLGYFVGKNEHLKMLYIRPFTPLLGASVRDVMVPFFRGVSSNKSIWGIYLVQTDLLRGDLFNMLSPFFRNNYNLINIHVNSCNFGDEGCRLFALALGSSTHKSLQNLSLRNNNIEDEGMVDIFTSLSKYPQLQKLNLYGNCLRKNGCVALATLLRCSVKVLQNLSISRNEINDEGIEALVPAFTNHNSLQNVYLSQNPSIATRGWQSLASILESPTSNLKHLYVDQNNVDNEAASAFANVLANNHTLHTLYLSTNSQITAQGWLTFSKLLCNTSSVHATFLSNHTLRNVGTFSNAIGIIEPLLRLNARDDKEEVAVIKMLQSHEYFDMLPFFEWEFKVLPLALRWLDRASEFEMPEDFDPNIDGRKLSTIYQFVRGLPLLYVETRLRKELEDIKAEEKQIEEEFIQRKKMLQERKAIIMKRLAGQ